MALLGLDPVSLLLGGLGGGGSTEVSQSLQNNFSSNINTIIQGGSGNPGTGPVSLPQTGSAPSSTSGSTPSGLDFLNTPSDLPLTGTTTSTDLATGGTSSSWYWIAAATVVGVALFIGLPGFMMSKRKR